MRIELLLVPLLEAEDHLTRDNALLSSLELEIRVQGNLRRVFVHMGGDFALVHVVLRNAFLEAAHCSQSVQCSRVHFLTTIGNDTDYNLLPSIFTPGS